MVRGSGDPGSTESMAGGSPVAPFSLEVAGRIVSGVAGTEGPSVALVFHHGTPGMAPAWQPLVDAAASKGLRYVACSRPGYAGSSRHEGRSVADVASDLAAVLNHLGVERFVTVGWSGGGPHALACAALLEGRCAAAATVAGVAPYGSEGLDWTAGMGPENVEEFGLALEAGSGLLAYLEAAAESMKGLDGAGLAAALGGLVGEPDRACLTGPFGAYLAADFDRCLANGVEGWYDDDLAFTRPWGFELSRITCPVTIWRAGVDLMVPPAHGEWLAAHIPRAEERLVDREGHISLLANSIGDVVARLAEAASA